MGESRIPGEVRAANQEKVEAAKRKLLSDETYANLAETFAALADSNRAKITYSLIEQELCVISPAWWAYLSQQYLSTFESCAPSDW